MGLLLPSIEEQDLLASQVNEALNLYGVSITLFDSEKISMYGDSINLKEGVRTKLLLDEAPPRPLLKNLGWFESGKEEQATIAYMSFSEAGNIQEVRRDSIVVFPDRLSMKIADVNRQYLNGVWYIVKLVPWGRDRVSHKEEKRSTQTTLLKQPRKEVL